MKFRINGKKYSPEGVLLLLPALLLYGAVIVFPVCSTFYTSFFEWNGIKQQAYRFVGLENYRTFFHDYQTATAFKNVFMLAGTGVFLTIPIAFFLATVINQKFRGLRLFKTFYFMPVVINRIAISLMFTFILYPKMGPVTVLLREFGIRGVNILGNYATAGLAAIPDEIYEAAQIDGVSSFQKLRYITIPMMKSTFKIVLVFVFTGAFKMFDLVMGLTSGGPGGATEVPNTLLYNNAFTYSRLGYADSIAVVVVLICLAFSFVVNLVFRQRD